MKIKKVLITLAIAGIIVPCFAAPKGPTPLYQRWVNSGQDNCYDGDNADYTDAGLQGAHHYMRQSGWYQEYEITGKPGDPNTPPGFIGGMDYRAEQDLINFYGFDLRCPIYSSIGALQSGNPSVVCQYNTNGSEVGFRTLYDTPQHVNAIMNWFAAVFAFNASGIFNPPKYLVISDYWYPNRDDSNWQQVTFSDFGIVALGVSGTIPATYTFPDTGRIVNVRNAGQAYAEFDTFSEIDAVWAQLGNPNVEKVYARNDVTLWKQITIGSGHRVIPQWYTAWNAPWVNGEPSFKGYYMEDYYIYSNATMCANNLPAPGLALHGHGDWRWLIYNNNPKTKQ